MLKDEIIKTYGDRVRIRVCGILIEDDKILLTKQLLNNSNNYFWSPPGGGIEFGESIEECLKREFLEETGLIVSVKDFITINEHLQPPLHSIELFYNVEKLSGTLILGNDPELPKNKQSIRKCVFYEVDKMKNEKENEFHPILFQLISKK